MGQIRKCYIFLLIRITLRKIFRIQLSGISKLKSLLLDFDKNFRTCQKWGKLLDFYAYTDYGDQYLEMRQIKNCSIFLLTCIRIYQIFWIFNPEYLNSKSYRWILMKISEHVRNGPNYQVTTLFCLSGPVSGKYSGLLIRNVLTKNITGECW